VKEWAADEAATEVDAAGREADVAADDDND
jgi:hypothetical protein